MKVFDFFLGNLLTSLIPAGALPAYIASLEILELSLYCLGSPCIFILVFLLHCLVHNSTPRFISVSPPTLF